jgi:hypothetical protein
MSKLSERGTKVYRRRGLPDTTLLVRHGEDPWKGAGPRKPWFGLLSGLDGRHQARLLDMRLLLIVALQGNVSRETLCLAADEAFTAPTWAIRKA